MAFTVLNTIALDRFARKRRDAGKPLADWLNVVKRAAWRSLAELRRTFPAADGVNVPAPGGGVVVVTVFNIKGNRYRLLAVVSYANWRMCPAGRSSSFNVTRVHSDAYARERNTNSSAVVPNNVG
jgi:mRNA-degrading endonuclease HigB of HigAB toxin-antitoxin module